MRCLEGVGEGGLLGNSSPASPAWGGVGDRSTPRVKPFGCTPDPTPWTPNRLPREAEPGNPSGGSLFHQHPVG